MNAGRGSAREPGQRSKPSRKSTWILALACRIAAALAIPTGIGLAADRRFGETAPLMTAVGTATAVVIASAIIARVFTRRFKKLAPMKELDE